MEKKRTINTKDKLKIVQYPCEDFTAATNNNSGFLIGSEGYWHNGIHLHTVGAIKSICDGEIAALRLNSSYLIEDTRFDNINIPYSYFIFNNLPIDSYLSEYFDSSDNGFLKLKDELTESNCKSDEAKEKRIEAYKILDKVYSNCFILIKHKLETNSDSPNPIVFYSLYNHLKPLPFLTPKQKASLFCYNSFLRINKFEQYGYVEAYKYDDSKDSITLVQQRTDIKIPSETSLFEGSLYRVKWTLNGLVRTAYIKKEYVRSYEVYNTETKKSITVYETKRQSKDSKDSAYLTEPQMKKIGTSDYVPIYNSTDSDSRNVIATVSKTETIILGNTDTYFRTFFSHTYTDDEKNKAKGSFGISVTSKSLQKLPGEKFLIFSLDTIKTINSKFQEYISIHGSNYFASLIKNKEEWSLIPDKGLFVNNELILNINLFDQLKTYSIPTYRITLKTELGSIINPISEDYRIPSETRLEIIKQQSYKSVSWTINGKSEEALLDTNKILFYTSGNGCETKRPRRFFEPEDSSKYLSINELKRSTDNKIIIYNHPERKFRNVKYLVNKNTNFIVTNFEDLEKLFEKSAKDICDSGVQVQFNDPECGYGNGYLYFDMHILEKNNKEELYKKVNNIKNDFLNWVNSREDDDTQSFGNFFEYKYEMKSEFSPTQGSRDGNEVLLPDNDEKPVNEGKEKRIFEKIRRGTVLGYAGYTLLDYSDEKGDKEESIKTEQKNEDATSVHFEIFAPDINFTNFLEKEREKYSADILIKDNCYGHKDKKTTVTKTKYINLDVSNLQEKLKKSDNSLIKPLSFINTLLPKKQSQLTEDLTLCYFKKTGKTVSLVDSEIFIELEFQGKLLEFNENEFITRFDFDAYNTSNNLYTVDKFKLADTYIVNHTGKKFISAQLNPNLKIPLYPDMKYPGLYCVDESPNDLKKKYRQTQFIYLPGEKQKFFVPEKAMEYFTEFDHLLLLNNGKVLRKEDVLEEPTEVKWAEEEIIIPKDSYTDTLKTFSENKTIQWRAIKKDNTIYWIKETDISSEMDCKEVAERIIYDDWNNFFTDISSDKKNWGTVKCDEKEKLLEALNIEKGEEKALDDKKFIELFNQNRDNVFNVFYKAQTEWDPEYAKKITDTLSAYEKEVKKNMMSELCFWNELDDNLKNKTENYYFNPLAFLHHVDRVATPLEFNPYEDISLSNPGFAPFVGPKYTGGSYKDSGYAKINLAFNAPFNGKKHAGIDFDGARDFSTPVHALVYSTVIGTGYHSEWGNYIVLQNNTDSRIFYILAHLHKVVVKSGTVLPKMTVGYVGNTGNCWSNCGGKYKSSIRVDTSAVDLAEGWGRHLHLQVVIEKNSDYIQIFNDGILKGMDSIAVNPFNHKESWRQ